MHGTTEIETGNGALIWQPSFSWNHYRRSVPDGTAAARRPTASRRRESRTVMLDDSSGPLAGQQKRPAGTVP